MHEFVGCADSTVGGLPGDATCADQGTDILEHRRIDDNELCVVYCRLVPRLSLRCDAARDSLRTAQESLLHARWLVPRAMGLRCRLDPLVRFLCWNLRSMCYSAETSRGQCRVRVGDGLHASLPYLPHVRQLFVRNL